MDAFRVNMRAILKARREWRQAEKAYKALCGDLRGATLHVDIRIHPDDPEWADITAPGLIGIRTTVPLTPRGELYIANIPGKIRKTCIRELIAMQRKDDEAAYPPVETPKSPQVSDTHQEAE